MAAVDKEAGMIDFQERLVELLRSDDEGYDDLPLQGQAKVFRPAGCWVYRVDLGEEEEFHRWLVDSFLLAELCKTEVRGEFPMLRVVSSLD
jgi:hypothetical protein